MKLVQWNMLCLEQLFISSRKCAIMKLYSYGNLILQYIYYRIFFSISSVVQYRTCLFLFLFLYFIIYASLKWSLCSILCSYCVQGNIFLINSLLLSSSEGFNRMISKFMCFCLNYFYLNTTVSNQEQVGGQDDPRQTYSCIQYMHINFKHQFAKINIKVTFHI